MVATTTEAAGSPSGNRMLRTTKARGVWRLTQIAPQAPWIYTKIIRL